MSSLFQAGIRPRPSLARAAADLIKASAPMKPSGIVWPLTGKLRTARWVEAPQSEPSGTGISPIESFSTRMTHYVCSGRLVKAAADGPGLAGRGHSKGPTVDLPLVG